MPRFKFQGCFLHQTHGAERVHYIVKTALGYFSQIILVE